MTHLLAYRVATFVSSTSPGCPARPLASSIAPNSLDVASGIGPRIQGSPKDTDPGNLHDSSGIGRQILGSPFGSGPKTLDVLLSS